jgi:hypothetical protein
MRKIAIAVWTLALSAGVMAGAQENASGEPVPALSRLIGAYRYIGNLQSDEQRISEQIEDAISNMNSFIRRKARSKLENVNSIVKAVRIASKGDDVTVVLDDFTVTAPTDGSKRPIKTPNGESAQAFFHVESASLIQEIEQTRATRKNTFRFDKAGKLVMKVQETSSRLNSPVQYDLIYASGTK